MDNIGGVSTNTKQRNVHISWDCVRGKCAQSSQGDHLHASICTEQRGNQSRASLLPCTTMTPPGKDCSEFVRIYEGEREIKRVRDGKAIFRRVTWG